MALIAAACVLATIIAVAGAEDATEATTFGADGIAKPSLGVKYEETGFRDLFARADGGLVVQRGEQVESYLANGAPDPASPPQPVWQNRRVFPLAGGKSLVSGEKGLTRVNPDGASTPASATTGGCLRTAAVRRRWSSLRARSFWPLPTWEAPKPRSHGSPFSC